MSYQYSRMYTGIVMESYNHGITELPRLEGTSRDDLFPSSVGNGA